MTKEKAISIISGYEAYGCGYCMQGGEEVEEALRLAVDALRQEIVIRCKDCRYFETDHWEKVNEIPLIVAHEICTRWGGGCKTAEDGYCFMAERAEE